MKKNLSFLSPCTSSASVESGLDQIARKVHINSINPKAILPHPQSVHQPRPTSIYKLHPPLPSPTRQVTPPPALPPKDKAISQRESRHNPIDLQRRQPLPQPTPHVHTQYEDSDSEVDDPYDTIDIVPLKGLVPRPPGQVPRLQIPIPRPQGPIIKPKGLVTRRHEHPAPSDSDSDSYEDTAPPTWSLESGHTRSAPCSPKVKRVQFVPLSSPQLQRKQEHVATTTHPIATTTKYVGMATRPGNVPPLLPKKPKLPLVPHSNDTPPIPQLPLTPPHVATPPVTTPPTDPPDDQYCSGDSVRNIIQRMNKQQ